MRSITWLHFIKKRFWLFFFCCGLVNPVKADSLIIYAAASTINVVQEVSKLYQQQSSLKIQTSFASSGTLAKQIAQGAPAHVFLSANPLWMDYLEQKKLLTLNSRFNLLRNRLVMVTPNNDHFVVQWAAEFDLSKAFQGRFSMGHPDYVPAGIYAKQALRYFKWWSPLQSRLVAAQDVRAALIFVERGEVEMGIVYETDALISKHVRIVGQFPEKSHSPLVYPIALIAANQTPLAAQFLQFLQTPEVLKIYTQNGFGIVHK